MAPPAKKQRTNTANNKPKQQPAQQQREAKEMGGDDLEDNFLLEDDDAGAGMSSGDEGFALSGDEGAAYDNVDEDSLPLASTSTSTASKKRPAEDDAAQEAEGQAEAKKSKKAKGAKGKGKKEMKKKEAAAAAGAKKEGGAEGEEQETDDTALLPVEVVADRIAEKQRRAMPDVTGLEMDEMRISQSMIQDTSSCTSRKTLAEFLKAALPTQVQTLSKPPKAPGSPRLIVLSAAALRVADLCREGKEFAVKGGSGGGGAKGKDAKGEGKGKEGKAKGQGIEVAKLFAKHFKLSEHTDYLQKTYVGLAIGTPNRIEKLLNETEALHLTHLSHIILDTTHLDAKKRSLLDNPEARGDLFKLLGCAKVMERLREGKARVVLF
ncbi:hypothetical protein JCM10213_007815 [Rhodosporidiobolus nylandii]